MPKFNEFSRWWNWKNWTFGVRWMWQPHMRFVVLEVGPAGLSIEFELESDYA